ncbi:DUF6510 family protein [Nocardia arizonensis]|uniref:DUF6510 family protein n=1 Tax=Nocardia arizonensis TaxID=1141647 RepID=UPI0006D0DDD5|nr:DUF6510 family protein [Nocardia arizonensis]
MREQPAPYLADDNHVDGNALAGPLSEIFVGDVTVCACRCGACGAVAPIAHALVYPHGPGAVARCASCAAIVLRLTTTPSGRWFDLGEGASLCLPVPDGF